MASPRFEAFVTKHGSWLGPLIAIPGLLSYFMFFSRWPAFRDTPSINLMLLGIAVGLSGAGLRRAWPAGGWRRVTGVAGLAFSGSLAALLIVYCYVLSYELPDEALAAKGGDPIPRAVLLADDGSEVDLHAAAQERLILVFYRGFW